MTQPPQQQWPAGPSPQQYRPAGPTHRHPPAGPAQYPPQSAPGAPQPSGSATPPPAQSTRTLSVAAWTCVGIVVLLLPLMVLWLMQGFRNLEFFREFSGRAAAGSGDGQGLKGGADAIAHWEFLIKVQAATLVAVVLLGVFALVARTGRAWARILCTVLTLFPIGVIIYGVIGSGAEGLWGLIFLLPMFTMLVLWWLPGTTRGIRAKAARRRQPVPAQQWQ